MEGGAGSAGAGRGCRSSTALRYRYAVLAAGTLAQTSYSAIPPGLAVLAPALRARYGLSLTEVGVVLAASNVGSIPSLYLWGLATDRLGERSVVALGLLAAAGCLVGAAYARSFPVLTLTLLAAGAAGASVNSASGRAVMHWFAPRSRGLALGIRQTAVPVAGAWSAFVLPALDANHGAHRALLALAAGMILGAIVGFAVLREGPEAVGKVGGTPAGLQPIRDRAMWVLSLGSALVIAPQVCIVGFLVVFLHGHRGLTTTAAAVVLGVVNVIGAAARIGAGRFSDRIGDRVGPLRLIALTTAVLVALTAVVLGAPLALLLPVLVAAGVFAISWNGLSFTAAVEAAGHARSGAAIGVQQTLLACAGAGYPIAFGALVAASSWRAGFALVAVLPFAGWRLLAAFPRARAR